MKKQSKFSVLIAILLSIITTSCNSQNQPLDSTHELQTSATVSELVSAMEEPDYTITTTQQEWNDQIYTIYKMKTDFYEETLEPPLTEWECKMPVPDFLNEEQQLLYRRAYSIYPTFVGAPEHIDFYPRKDGEPFDSWFLYSYKTSEGTVPAYYYAAQGRYAKWDDFVSMGTSIFTVEYFNSLSSWFLNIDGNIYLPDVAMGSAWGQRLDSPPDTFRLISKSDTEIHFEFTCYFYYCGHPEDYNLDDIEPIKKVMPFTMVLTDNGWRFSEFHRAEYEN